jgi:hypothetical protein
VGVSAVEQLLFFAAMATAVWLGVRAIATQGLKQKYEAAMVSATRAAGGPTQYEPSQISSVVSTQQSWSKAVQRGDGSYRRDEKFSTAVEPGAKEVSVTDTKADDWWR